MHRLWCTKRFEFIEFLHGYWHLNWFKTSLPSAVCDSYVNFLVSFRKRWNQSSHLEKRNDTNRLNITQVDAIKKGLTMVQRPKKRREESPWSTYRWDYCFHYVFVSGNRKFSRLNTETVVIIIHIGKWDRFQKRNAQLMHENPVGINIWCNVTLCRQRCQYNASSPPNNWGTDLVYPFGCTWGALMKFNPTFWSIFFSSKNKIKKLLQNWCRTVSPQIQLRLIVQMKWLAINRRTAQYKNELHDIREHFQLKAAFHCK